MTTFPGAPFSIYMNGSIVMVMGLMNLCYSGRLCSLQFACLMFRVSLLTSSLFLLIIKRGFQQQVELGLSRRPHLFILKVKLLSFHKVIFDIFLFLAISVEGFSSERGRLKIMRLLFSLCTQCSIFSPYSYKPASFTFCVQCNRCVIPSITG